MKKIVKILNTFFEDDEFAYFNPKESDDIYDMIHFPFGFITKIDDQKEEFLSINFTIDAPEEFIFDIPKALHEFDIKFFTDVVYCNETGTYWDEEAYKKFNEDRLFEQYEDSSETH